MCNCNCRVQSVVPTSITIAGSTATISLPASFLPTIGGIYDIPLSVVIPDGTN